MISYSWLDLYHIDKNIDKEVVKCQKLKKTQIVDIV